MVLVLFFLLLPKQVGRGLELYELIKYGNNDAFVRTNFLDSVSFLRQFMLNDFSLNSRVYHRQGFTLHGYWNTNVK